MELVTIPFEVFKSIWDADVASSQQSKIEKTIQDLKTTYHACFAGRGDERGDHRDAYTHYPRGGGHSRHHGERDHWSHADKSHRGRDGYSGGGGGGGGGRRGGYHLPPPRKMERPRIGVREMSREDISRKDFMANMNKLSRQNFEAILRHIRTTYNSVFLQHYMDIIWSMMIRQNDYQDLYITVIDHLLQITPSDKKGAILSYWNDKCRLFFESSAWMPTEDVLNAIGEEYSEFCDYIKWKKMTGASFIGWLRLMASGIVKEHYRLCFDTVMCRIDESLETETYRLLDCLLEWLLQMMSLGIVCDYPDSYVVQLNEWKGIVYQRGLSSSLRFKIIDILDLLQKKGVEMV